MAPRIRSKRGKRRTMGNQNMSSSQASRPDPENTGAHLGPITVRSSFNDLNSCTDVRPLPPLLLPQPDIDHVSDLCELEPAEWKALQEVQARLIPPFHRLDPVDERSLDITLDYWRAALRNVGLGPEYAKFLMLRLGNSNIYALLSPYTGKMRRFAAASIIDMCARDLFPDSPHVEEVWRWLVHAEPLETEEFALSAVQHMLDRYIMLSRRWNRESEPRDSEKKRYLLRKLPAVTCKRLELLALNWSWAELIQAVRRMPTFAEAPQPANAQQWFYRLTTLPSAPYDSYRQGLVVASQGRVS
eukprot:GHVU01215524.1.p1 GENE.GHVU01215524.1~~GHVU01215524.1.p1  ORF type:complete len:301 (+),score=11.48 GHVU01215524.1:299-1201(+)